MTQLGWPLRRRFTHASTPVCSSIGAVKRMKVEIGHVQAENVKNLRRQGAAFLKSLRPMEEVFTYRPTRIKRVVPSAEGWPVSFRAAFPNQSALAGNVSNRFCVVIYEIPRIN
jgi:hypothetical protein